MRNVVEQMTNLFEFLQKKLGIGNKELGDGIITFCKEFCWLNKKRLHINEYVSYIISMNFTFLSLGIV